MKKKPCVVGCKHQHPYDDRVVVRLPAGVGTHVAVAALGGELLIGRRATLTLPGGGFAEAAQVGRAPVRIGKEAHLASVTTEGSIVLHDHARVEGNVTTAGVIHEHRGVTVAGHRRQGATITPYTVDSWSTGVDDNPRRCVTIPSHGHMRLPPGSYGCLALARHGQLRLRSGTYAFTSIHIGFGASVVVDDELGPVVVSVREKLTYRGRIRSVTGGHPAFLVAVTGSHQRCVLRTPFRGTLVAPHAQLVLLRGDRPHEGTFFAQQVKVAQGATVMHRPFRAFVATPRWSLPVAAHASLGPGAFDDTGAVLTSEERKVVAISATGTATTLLELAQPHRFVIDPAGQRFAVLTPTQVEVRDRSAALIASYGRTPSGYALFVPGTDLTYVPEVEEDGIERAVVTHARFYGPAGLRHRFETPGLRMSRLTPHHLVYATRTELVRTTLAGLETWRRPLRLLTFEVSANGATLIGVLDHRGSCRVVHVDLANGMVTEETTLDSAFWNVAIAPLGRYSVATTQRAAHIFHDGKLVRRTDLGVGWTVSADVSNKGHVALGAQLPSHEALVILTGTAGPGALRMARPIERDGYRPNVRFSPDGQLLLLNGSTGLVAYEIQTAH
jgi:hypothetical protein